jgi:hypothetical protein
MCHPDYYDYFGFQDPQLFEPNERAISKAPTMSQWITHDGKGCPVDRDQLVLIQRATGNVEFGKVEYFVVCWWLWVSPGVADIIAYQVIEPYKVKQDATE